MDPEGRVHLLPVSGPGVSHGLDGVHAAVLRGLHGDDHQSLRKGAHGVLLQGRALVGLLADHQGAGHLRSAPAIHHVVVGDEVADDTQSMVAGTLGLLYDHLISSSDENSDGSGVLTLLDDQHLSLVDPNEISFTRPAKPSFSAVSSENLGVMWPPVAMGLTQFQILQPSEPLAGYSGEVND